MKTTIFIRLLMATLLPLTLVFVLIVTTISNIIFAYGVSAAKDATHWEATQVADQFSGRLDEMRGLLEVVSQSLADIDHGRAEAPGKAERS